MDRGHHAALNIILVMEAELHLVLSIGDHQRQLVLVLVMKVRILGQLQRPVLRIFDQRRSGLEHPELYLFE